MNPNQPYYRMVTLGGQAWLWLFSLALAIGLGRLAWVCAQQEPRVLGLEAASVIAGLAFTLLPPCWQFVSRARRRYQLRGLMPAKQSGIAIALLATGLIYGLLFPIALALELLVAGITLPVSQAATLILGLAYLAKVVLALLLVRAGWSLLRLAAGRSANKALQLTGRRLPGIW